MTRSGVRGIKRAGWVVVLSAAAAVIASRTNRAPEVEARPRQAVLAEIIPEVELDTRSFRKAVASLAKKTRAKLVIDHGLFPLLYLEDAQADAVAGQPKATRRLVNHSLEAILKLLLVHWENQLQVEYQVDGETITFFDSNLPLRGQRRIHDLRPFAQDWTHWHDVVQSWKPPPPPPGPVGGGLFGGRIVRYPEKPEIQSAAELVEFFRGSILGNRSAQFDIIANWDGVVIIEAPVEFQIQFQKFLALWTESVALSEGGRR